MFVWVATELAERTPAGSSGRPKGTTLEQTAQERKQDSSWKNCGC
jgi:hypothetical protein